jgi:hypothetical protein
VITFYVFLQLHFTYFCCYIVRISAIVFYVFLKFLKLYFTYFCNFVFYEFLQLYFTYFCNYILRISAIVFCIFLQLHSTYSWKCIFTYFFIYILVFLQVHFTYFFIYTLVFLQLQEEIIKENNVEILVYLLLNIEEKCQSKCLESNCMVDRCSSSV